MVYLNRRECPRRDGCGRITTHGQYPSLISDIHGHHSLSISIVLNQNHMLVKRKPRKLWRDRMKQTRSDKRTNEGGLLQKSELKRYGFSSKSRQQTTRGQRSSQDFREKSVSQLYKSPCSIGTYNDAKVRSYGVPKRLAFSRSIK